MAATHWLWTPTTPTALAENEVHVWSLDLDQPASRVAELKQMLSGDEQERAARFATEELRGRFVTGRAVLRQVLGKYSGCEPQTLSFRYGPQGKPELEGARQGKLHFNLSHTLGVGLIAVTRRCAVGVDVERVRDTRNPQEIADRFFTRTESAQLEKLPVSERAAAFFRLWTRKEAWLKARGDGIAESLERVEVSFLPGEPARVVQVAGEPNEAAEWTLAELAPAWDFVGALAWRGSGLNVQCGHWVK